MRRRRRRGQEAESVKKYLNGNGGKGLYAQMVIGFSCKKGKRKKEKREKKKGIQRKKGNRKEVQKKKKTKGD